MAGEREKNWQEKLIQLTEKDSDHYRYLVSRSSITGIINNFRLLHPLFSPKEIGELVTQALNENSPPPPPEEELNGDIAKLVFSFDRMGRVDRAFLDVALREVYPGAKFPSAPEWWTKSPYEEE